MSNLLRTIDDIPPPAAHAVGVGSGLTGVALWAEWAKHLTVIAGLAVAFLALVGGAFYAAYWALKAWAKWKRVRAGDYSDE